MDQRFQLPRLFPATACARFISHARVVGTCQERAERKSLERIRLEMATSTTDTEMLSIEEMVRGYHVYQEIWDAALGEQLSCKREPGNCKDPFAVAVVRALVTVGHLPKKISSVCSMFLLRGGTIHCQVIAPRHYSGDLPQGGLKIPCMLTFEGDRKDVAKARRLVRYALFASPEVATKDEPSRKKIKHDNSSNETKGIITGEKLSDLHINHARVLHS